MLLYVKPAVCCYVYLNSREEITPARGPIKNNYLNWLKAGPDNINTKEIIRNKTERNFDKIKLQCCKYDMAPHQGWVWVSIFIRLQCFQTSSQSGDFTDKFINILDCSGFPLIESGSPETEYQ